MSLLIRPQVSEKFLFFIIQDVKTFKANLAKFKPTSSFEVTEILKEINRAKEKARATGSRVQHVHAVQNQVAFTRLGMQKIGITEPTRDTIFDSGPMKKDRASLGDQGEWVKAFEDGTLHGVIMIAASSEWSLTLRSTRVSPTLARFKAMVLVKTKVEEIRQLFGPSISIVHEEIGNVLANRTEHFGYRDGISQPALR